MTPDDPRHGTNAGHHAGCRDSCCRDARNRYERNGRKRRELGHPGLVDPLGTRRRIQALMALGWTQSAIASTAGVSSVTVIDRLIRQVKQVRTSTAKQIADAYEQMSMTLGPSAVTRARAQRHGYPTPLCWDNIDDPDEIPAGHHTARVLADVHIGDEYDHAVITRILGGDFTAERREIVARWPGTLAELERQTGWRTARYTTRDQEAS
jgi:hypothetical protein